MNVPPVDRRLESEMKMEMAWVRSRGPRHDQRALAGARASIAYGECVD